MKQLHSTKGYIPFDSDYFDQIEKAMNDDCKIHYFDAEGQVMDANGTVTCSFSPDNFAHFVVLNTDTAIRIDRIITLNGSPGPAFDEYDLFALQCLTCMGGM
ncbi:hypothetical protein [Geofilum rubicundum]|uniref:Uncharacterized protein n=1 Tax=Geofilum rubicundum JCM 15548 TaxID=1236989 RepID=A0A0E9M1A8_9BACT|nr:hypothetical protein [Geofilum rubicundum]GAO31264.1 hypothetical protein JCM15548_13612 [Geofilum rubicundum JCM 15548]